MLADMIPNPSPGSDVVRTYMTRIAFTAQVGRNSRGYSTNRSKALDMDAAGALAAWKEGQVLREEEKTFLSRIPFKSAVNAERASERGTWVAYKEKSRGGDETGETEKRRTFQSLNCGAPERALVAMQCAASNIRMAVRRVRRRIDSYLDRFAHLSASKSALSLSLFVPLTPRRIKPEM